MKRATGDGTYYTHEVYPIVYSDSSPENAWPNQFSKYAKKVKEWSYAPPPSHATGTQLIAYVMEDGINHLFVTFDFFQFVTKYLIARAIYGFSALLSWKASIKCFR